MTLSKSLFPKHTVTIQDQKVFTGCFQNSLETFKSSARATVCVWNLGRERSPKPESLFFLPQDASLSLQQ